MYITISDVLYNVLKLLYGRLPVSIGVARENAFQESFVAHFMLKLAKDLDDENTLYNWALAAAVDGRHSSLHWLRRIWEHPAHWPKVTHQYNLKSFMDMVQDQMENLVSSSFSLWSLNVCNTS